MCEFCQKHGGSAKRWYLNPSNFREDLLEDKGRIKVLKDICGWGIDYYIDYASRMMSKTTWPVFGSVIRKIGNLMAPSRHSGQVIPIEEALQLLPLADNFVALECACCRLVSGERKPVCINFGPIKHYFETLKPSERMETLTLDEARARLKEHDEQGMIHQVLVAKMPYPIVICNCNLKYCTAFKQRLNWNVERAVLKSHHVIQIDQNKCDGCSDLKQPACVSRCQVNALIHDKENEKIIIKTERCFGCGVCRIACPTRALTLTEREPLLGPKSY
ncbi:MAG: ATP-binding protein [Candidatus Helarchaeota archaeon]